MERHPVFCLTSTMSPVTSCSTLCFRQGSWRRLDSLLLYPANHDVFISLHAFFLLKISSLWSNLFFLLSSNQERRVLGHNIVSEARHDGRECSGADGRSSSRARGRRRGGGGGNGIAFGRARRPVDEGRTENRTSNIIRVEANHMLVLILSFLLRQSCRARVAVRVAGSSRTESGFASGSRGKGRKWCLLVC